MTSGAETRVPITDAAAWIDALADDSQRALMALGQLLVGVAERPPKNETAERFTLRCLGVPSHSHVIDEERALSAVTRLTAALALAELIEKHAGQVQLGPHSYADPPAWTESEVGDVTYHHSQKLRAAFSAGTLLPHTPVVISIDTQMSLGHNLDVTAYVHRHFQRDARAVLDRLLQRADQLNPYRGRVCRASFSLALALSLLELPPLTRENVIVAPEVWK